MQGEYPVYLHDSHLYTTKLVENAHQRTLHGGVRLTMARIRENVLGSETQTHGEESHKGMLLLPQISHFSETDPKIFFAPGTDKVNPNLLTSIKQKLVNKNLLV